MTTTYTPAVAEKLAAPFTRKGSPTIGKIHHEGGRITATNAYIALNLPAPVGCAWETVPAFPSLDFIVKETKEKEKTASIVLNAEYLELIAKSLRKYAKATNTRPHIRLDIYGTQSPAILTLDGTDAFALIMPIRQ